MLGVAKGAFYAWQRQKSSARAQADEQLTDEIKDIYDDSRCRYGAPRVHAELRNRSKRLGRKRVARLMRQAGLVGRCPRRFRRTTTPDPTTQVQDLVQRKFRTLDSRCRTAGLKWCASAVRITRFAGARNGGNASRLPASQRAGNTNFQSPS